MATAVLRAKNLNEILGLEDPLRTNFYCVGTSPSGTRCSEDIAFETAFTATLLLAGQSIYVDEVTLKNHLAHTIPRLLCEGHKNQADEKIVSWMRSIEEWKMQNPIEEPGEDSMATSPSRGTAARPTFNIVDWDLPAIVDVGDALNDTCCIARTSSGRRCNELIPRSTVEDGINLLEQIRPHNDADDQPWLEYNLTVVARSLLCTAYHGSRVQQKLVVLGWMQKIIEWRSQNQIEVPGEDNEGTTPSAPESPIFAPVSRERRRRARRRAQASHASLSTGVASGNGEEGMAPLPGLGHPLPPWRTLSVPTSVAPRISTFQPPVERSTSPSYIYGHGSQAGRPYTPPHQDLAAATPRSFFLGASNGLDHPRPRPDPRAGSSSVSAVASSNPSTPRTLTALSSAQINALPIRRAPTLSIDGTGAQRETGPPVAPIPQRQMASPSGMSTWNADTPSSGSENPTSVTTTPPGSRPPVHGAQAIQNNTAPPSSDVRYGTVGYPRHLGIQPGMLPSGLEPTRNPRPSATESAALPGMTRPEPDQFVRSSEALVQNSSAQQSRSEVQSNRFVEHPYLTFAPGARERFWQRAYVHSEDEASPNAASQSTVQDRVEQQDTRAPTAQQQRISQFDSTELVTDGDEGDTASESEVEEPDQAPEPPGERSNRQTVAVPPGLSGLEEQHWDEFVARIFPPHPTHGRRGRMMVASPPPPTPADAARLRWIRDEECPICFAPFTDPHSTRCGHIFCLHCVENWVAVEKHCPFCRQDAWAGSLSKVHPNTGELIPSAERLWRDAWDWTGMAQGTHPFPPAPSY